MQISPSLSGRPTTKQLSQSFDLIVIGGGINGSGIARDAAERGLKVLLVEKNDFGTSASAYNSRLIHGGLRYFEHFDFSLVRESLRERERLLKNAPHLVKPLAFGIPVYQDSRRGKFLIWLGMVLYHLFSFDKSLPSYRMLNKADFVSTFPGIQPEGLKGGALYYDAQVSFPERLCVENAIAAKEHGAVVMNHATVESISVENQKASGVQIQDLITGEKALAKSPCIINATGVWVDDVIQRLQGHTSAKPISRKIGGTKGSHIIVRRFPGGPDKALYVEAKKDGRPFFILPWQDQYYLIGTTDLPYTGDLDKVIADSDELEYLKAETKRIFPHVELDILYTYSGIRPLPYAGNKPAGKITRKHIIHSHHKEGIPGLWSIIGGKLTTFRNLAEEAVDTILKALKRKLGRSTTRDNPLPGGLGVQDMTTFKQTQIPQSSKTYQVSPETLNYLIDIYGSRYTKVLDLTKENSAWKEPLGIGSLAIKAQVIYAARHEMASTTADVLMRRTGLALQEGVGLALAKETASLLGKELGWMESQIKADLEAFQTCVQTINKPIQSVKETNPSKSPLPSSPKLSETTSFT